MFDSEVYSERRKRLKKNMQKGLILFLGNGESAMNYADNAYHFRQDSTFLYYFGLDEPNLNALIDLDEGTEILFGDDFTMDDVIWMGGQRTMQEKARSVGVKDTASSESLESFIKTAAGRGRPIHFLPPYRADHFLMLQNLLETDPERIGKMASVELIKAVVEQRSAKSPEEIEQIEAAHAITYRMHTEAMRMARPGIYERDIAGAIQGIALSGGSGVSFPVIVTKNGEILHNHYHGNQLQEGDLLVNDSGAESVMHYAADITRTIPVSGRFSPKQREIYEIVLRAQDEAIKAIKPGAKYLDIHLLSAKVIAAGLKDLGLMQGNVDAAVANGAHALFYPHGLGHMMGLDVHDMENLGENYVGYGDELTRSKQFGLSALRLARTLQTDFVLTVEPGIYFIPALIEKWRSEKLHIEFLNYDNIAKYIGFGGIRIEDDVLVTKEGHRVIGQNAIPGTVAGVEDMCD